MRPLALITPSEVQRALRLAAEGCSLAAIRSSLSLSPKTWALLLAYPGFKEELDTIRRLALEDRAEAMLEVHQTIDDVQRANLYSKNLQWYLERTMPERFGRRESVDVTVRVDLREALAGARKRRAALEEEDDEADRLCS